jgi:microcompartment protein CcmL/EutN
MNAFGMVEVYGFTTAICCADIAAKAANVAIVALDTNKPANGDSAEVPLVMIVKMEGSVAAVESGVASARAYAEEKGLYITSHIISRPGVDIEKLAYLNNIGKDRQPTKEVKGKFTDPVVKRETNTNGKYTDPVAKPDTKKKEKQPAVEKTVETPEEKLTEGQVTIS